MVIWSGFEANVVWLLTMCKAKHTGIYMKDRAASLPDSTEALEWLTKGWKEQVEQH